MVEAADFAQLDELAHRRRLDVSGVRSVLVQGEVSSRPMVVADIGSEDAAEMCLVQDNHVIEAFAAKRADNLFHVRVLPG